MKRNLSLATLLVLAVGVLGLGVDAAAATKDEVGARLKARKPVLQEYKTAGKIGERWDGLVEAVDKSFMSDAKLAATVNAENADRKELYALIAAEEKTSADDVGQRAGKGYFDRAKPGEYLKTADGKWHRKA